MCVSLPTFRNGIPLAPKIKHWTSPPHGKYKINIEATMFKDLGYCGIGVVIRNDKGQMMGAMCKRVDFPLGAVEAEAKATEAGLLLAWDLGLKDIVVEGDSQLVIQALSGSIPPALPILKIVEGMKRLLVHFSYWKAVHTRRNANVAAHLLARNAKNVTDCVIWVEDTPPLIESQILHDIISLDLSPYY